MPPRGRRDLEAAQQHLELAVPLPNPPAVVLCYDARMSSYILSGFPGPAVVTNDDRSMSSLACRLPMWVAQIVRVARNESHGIQKRGDHHSLVPRGIFFERNFVGNQETTGGQEMRKLATAPENFTAPNADCPAVMFRIANTRQARDEPKPPWQRRTNVWRKATSPAPKIGRAHV